MGNPEHDLRQQGTTPTRLARVLDVDPDLGAVLPARELARAQESLIARAYNLQPGPWELRTPAPAAGALGLLCLHGLLGLRTAIEGRATLELLGRGDLLQPWVQLGPDTTVPPKADWQVFEASQLLLLDRSFALAAAGFPEVITELMHRLVMRSRRLCYQLAVNTSPRADDRVLYSLWALADRWGRVTHDGIEIRLSLNHEQIAELVCAQRPSVSSALTRLRDEGRVTYSRGSFVLHGEAPGPVKDLKKQVALKV